MTDQQRRRLASYQAISTHFADHPEAWSAKAPIQEAVSAWDGLLAEVRDAEQVQARNTTGATRTKGQQVDHVIDLAMRLVTRLRAYARLRDDPDLLAAVDVSRTELDDLNDVGMVAELKAITDAARARAEADLLPFEVTPALLDELDAEAAAVLPRQDARERVADDRTVATARLRALFSRFPPLRRTLDDLVDGLVEDEAFREGYDQARKVTG